MSLLKELLSEAQKKVQVADTQSPDIGVGDIFDDHFASPAKAANKSVANKNRQNTKLRDAISNADKSDVPQINRDKLPTDTVDVSNADGIEPVQKEPGTDMAVQSQDIRAAGKAKADWMTIDQLPGYMQNGIRAMGRVVFNSLTKTPLDEISVLANLGGHGPSERMDLNAVAHFAQTNAKEERDISMQFGEMVPGYEPEVKLYMTPHDTYLVVRDEMGQYIYSWETKDTKDAFVKKLK